jgi:hypothetical protein
MTDIKTTPAPTYWKCRACENKDWCDREKRCTDVLLSDEYYAWCLSEARRCADVR